MRTLSSYRDIGLEFSSRGSPLCCHLRTFCPVHVPQSLGPFQRRRKILVPLRCTPSSELATSEGEWLKKLPDKKKPLYSHSLPCVEAWLKSLGFCQNREDRSAWFVEKPGWHAHLSLDVTDLSIRYKERLKIPQLMQFLFSIHISFMRMRFSIILVLFLIYS